MQLTVETRFPMEATVTATINAGAPTHANLRIRVPSWATGEMKILVNGKFAGVGKAGTYVGLNRTWHDGDRIEFTLPASIRAKRYTGADQVDGRARYSFEYGPILLAAVGSSKTELSLDGGYDSERLASQLEAVEGSPLHFEVRGNRDVKFMPYWQVSKEEFTCYPSIRSLA